MLQRDYVMRAIEELAGALAAIAGLRRQNQHEAALQAVDDAKCKLPLVPGLVDRLAPEALVRMLDDEQLAARLLALYRHEAELTYLIGRREHAVRCLARANALEKALSASEPLADSGKA